jgi:hypothetical protein
MAHRVNSLLRSNRVALGVKRTTTSVRYATELMNTRPSLRYSGVLFWAVAQIGRPSVCRRWRELARAEGSVGWCVSITNDQQSAVSGDDFLTREFFSPSAVLRMPNCAK